MSSSVPATWGRAIHVSVSPRVLNLVVRWDRIGGMERIVGWIPLTVFVVLAVAGVAIGYVQSQA